MGTISQKEEAELLKKAIANSDTPSNLDVIHVGRGSIQIILRSSDVTYLLPFGISELNQQFNLLESPDNRQIATCIKWVCSRLPTSLNLFAYTGGERTYLRHFSIELEHERYCQRSDFTVLASQLAMLDLRTLEANSPFDPMWMHRVIASNCIILAGLIKSGTNKFMPTDLTIAHDILKQ